MRTKLFKLFGPLLLLHCSGANAELLTKVTVQQPTGTSDYTMYSTGKMYFSNNDLVIDTIGSGPVFTAKLSTIDKLLFSTFESTQSGNENLLNAGSVLAVYPASTSNSISIKGIDGTFKYAIFSVTGQQVTNGTGTADNAIDVSSLEKGVYFIQINSSILKFVKL